MFDKKTSSLDHLLHHACWFYPFFYPRSCAFFAAARKEDGLDKSNATKTNQKSALFRRLALSRCPISQLNFQVPLAKVCQRLMCAIAL
jgi:hypothetical protein